jgi:hypothetical protein
MPNLVDFFERATTALSWWKKRSTSRLGLRDLYFVIIGGGPVNQEWADEIDADGYGATAIHAVELVQELLSLKK